MKIGRKFNTFTKKEYFDIIENHKKYTDFNTLGIYRSIYENEKLSLSDKIEVRDYANTFFGKTFNFYQLKDPYTYFKLTTLGMELTKGDEEKFWNDIKTNQEKILKEKRIKHRNFGDYSKHNCGVEGCCFNGLMIKQGSYLAEMEMGFHSDRTNKYSVKLKSQRIKKERKDKHNLIKDELDDI